MTRRESESLLDDIPDGVLAVDVPTGTIQSVNETCCAILAREESTLVGLHLSEVATDESTPFVDEEVARARESGPVTVQWRARTGRETTLPVEGRLTTTTRGERDLAVLTLREQPQPAETKPPLERGRDRYRTLFDNDSLVLWEQDFSEARAYATKLADTGKELGAYLDAHPEELFEILGRMEVHMVNDAALDFYGVESKTELVENLDEMMVPDTRAGLTAMWKAVVDGDRYFCTECKFRPLDGDEIRYELMEVYVPEAHADDYSLVFTTATDITEQKRREEKLASAKERYRRILDRSSDYVLIHDEAGDIDYVSPGIEATLGYEPEELVGTDALDYVHPADEEKIRGVVEELLEDPETDITTEYRVRSADDDYRWVEARGGNYLDDPLIDGVMVTIRDIVERKQYEQELIAERDARSTLHCELASATSARTFASAVCTELVSMDTIAATQVRTITASDTMEIVASDADSEQHTATGVGRDIGSQTVTSLLNSGTDGAPTASTAVPIEHDGVTRGVLVVQFAEQAAASDTVEPLLQESADVLGYAMASEERQRALAADEWVQVTLTVGTAQTPLSRIVGAVGTTANLAAAVTRDDDTVLCYLDGVADTEALADAARRLPAIERVERLGDGGSTVQVVVPGPVPSAVVATHGGNVEAAAVTAETTTLQARVPQGAAFDPMLEAVRDRFDNVVTSDVTTAPTETGPSADPLAGLTERQREVLEVAYRGGYFDKPRTQNASEVADSLGVSRPAYDEVLRAGQRNLLRDLFTEG